MFRETEKKYKVIYPENANATYESILNYSTEKDNPYQRWYDSLFDKKLITFDDNGCILISKKLDERNRAFLNVLEGMHIEMCNENRKYLDYHRKRFFENGEN